MLVPLIGLIVGIFILFLSFLIFRGNSSLSHRPLLQNLSGDVVFLWGNSLVALAGILGVAGYWNIFNGNDLRLGRLFLLILGLFLSGYAFCTSLGEKNPLQSLTGLGRFKPAGVVRAIPYLLNTLAAIALGLIFLIAFCDYNYGGDAFMYHVPFAARLWGIIPPEQYTFEFFTENRLLGFPLLANWFQGLFWLIFQRIEATNLVAYFSLLILIFYLVKVVKIPFYLATFSLLAIPMVHMHAARSYIDLPGNVALSIIILTLYLLYTQKLTFNLKTILILFVSSFASANIKLQLIPLVFLLVLASLPVIIRHYWDRTAQRKTNLITLAKVFAVGTLACLVIFITPIKNILIHQNPVYPVKVVIAGQVLNHTEGSPDFLHPNIKKLLPPLRWARSVLEIDVFDKRRPWPWTLGMDFIAWGEERFGMGGYFGGYVVFNLVLLGVLAGRNWQKESKTALIFLGIMTAVTAWMPQSYELRYYMYWMIVLVSLNAYLVGLDGDRHPRLANPFRFQYLGLVTLVFTLVFVRATNKFFTYPAFQPLSHQLSHTEMLDADILAQLKDGGKYCIVGKAPNTFFYNSYFHPGRNYSVRGEFTLDENWIKEKCQGWKIIRLVGK